MISWRNEYRKSEEDRYIESNNWMCPNSPTGAHIWSVTTTLEHGKSISRHSCQVPGCGQTKVSIKKDF